jgi:hypothetical protein
MSYSVNQNSWPNSRAFDPLSDSLDKIWSGGSQKSDRDNRFNNYYDYYFSGEDVKIYIDGLFEPKHELDIASFAYSIKQEKQPLYGFWSYNYDAMLYGTRLITGEFTVYTRYPRRMTDLLEEAARVRSESPSPKAQVNNIISTLRPSSVQNSGQNQNTITVEDDEKNVQKYWAQSQLDRVTTDTAFAKNVKDSGHNIFSAHPPFNFIILYGAQEASLTPMNYSSSIDDREVDNIDRMLMADTNERLVRIDNIASPMKVVVQEVNLISMATMYGPGGQPLAENYQFMARDFYMTEADLGFIKNIKTTVTSEYETAKADVTTQTTSTNQQN